MIEVFDFVTTAYNAILTQYILTIQKHHIKQCPFTCSTGMLLFYKSVLKVILCLFVITQ